MNLQEESRLLDQSMVEDEGHLVLTERTVETLKRIYKHTEVKSVLEIGFNAGHSAMGWLALRMWNATTQSTFVSMNTLNSTRNALRTCFQNVLLLRKWIRKTLTSVT